MSGFTVSSLSNYAKENADNFIKASILGAKSLKYPGIRVVAGIKYQEKLPVFANTAPVQAGGTCAFNASGSSTFSDITLTVSNLKWQDTWCPYDLETKFLATKLTAGSNYEQLPFEQVIMDEVIANIEAQAEKYTWQGDTTLTNLVDLKQVDGWLKKIDAGSPTYATATAAVTKSNVISIFDDIYSSIPAELLNRPDKPMIAFCGWDVFRLLILALKDANAYHYDAGNAATAGEITLPASGLKVVAVNGLNPITGSKASYTQRIVCTYPQNLIVGTDLANEYEEADIWYSKDDQNIKGSIKWKVGYQVGLTTEVVTYKNS